MTDVVHVLTLAQAAQDWPADVRVIAVERFTRVLSALSEAGVPLPDGINVASDATNNTIFQEAIADVREVLVRGGGARKVQRVAHVQVIRPR